MAAVRAGRAFIPYYEHLMRILDSNELLKKTAIGFFKQLFWAAVPMVIGGVLLGPLGAAMGGAAGSALGYSNTNDYNSMVDVMRGLNADQKQQIVRKVQEEVGSASKEALFNFIATEAGRMALLKLLHTDASPVMASRS